MKPICLFLFLVTNLTGYAQKANPALSKKIDLLVQQQMKEIGIPGMAVAVVQNGIVQHMGTYGMANIEWNQPVTNNTAFQIASVTKLFTSTLVMKFIQDGKISLDDPINKFFPDAPVSWKPILVKHLLSHQSGIPWPASIGGYLGTKKSTGDQPVSKEQLYKDMTDSALTFHPGEKESYMNGDAFIIQMILEKIGGKEIGSLFQEEIFTPLQMHNSGFDGEMRNFPAQVMKPVKNKSQLFTKGKNGPLIFKAFYNTASYCSGGLYMSVEDAVRWAVSLDKSSLVKPEIVCQINTKMPLNGSFTALGWNRDVFNGHEALGHSGGPGLGDILYFPEKKLTIIVFSNDADMYPYMAATIAQLFFPDISLPPLTEKTIDRGYTKLF